MDKGVALVSDIYERGIEPGHNLMHFTEIDVSNRKARMSDLAIQLRQDLILAQGDIYLGRGYVNK
jgi:hypothetical protein